MGLVGRGAERRGGVIADEASASSSSPAHGDDDYPPISPYGAGLGGKCPRCGTGHLFGSFIGLAPRCDVCGLDFDFADAGDGPAVFVSFAAGLVVVGLALVIDVLYEPPIWVHLLISLPLVLILCLGLLRPLKGLLVALQYRNKAA